MTKQKIFFCSVILCLLFIAVSFGPQNTGAGSAPPQASAASGLLVIEGAQLWDGTGRPAIQDSVLIIEGGRIKAAGPGNNISIPQGAKVISAKGKTVIPGLINAHGHVGMVKGLKASRDNYSEENVRAQLLQYARYGITTVQSLGTDFEPMFKLRGPAAANEPVRATVFTAGRGFTGKGGYPAVLPGNAGIPREVDSVEEVKQQVQELAEQKVDMVKIWVDDHWGHYQKIRPELYRAIIEAAHQRNLRVMAHLFYLEDAKGLVRAGLDGMAHSVRDREIDDELLQLLKEKKPFAVATLVREESTFVYATPPAFLDDPFFKRWVPSDVISALKDPAYGQKVKSDPDFSRYPGQLTMAQRNLKKLFDAGVKIAFGSDSGPPARFQGFFEHRELELMVQAGLTAAQALQAATLNTAQALRIDRDFGSLEQGKRADFILVDGDPLKQILDVRKIVQVWIGGREVLDRSVPSEAANGQDVEASKPKRINKVVELLQSGQPVYYVGGRGGYEEGVRLAKTWADYITYEMEHGAYDVPALREFMRGLVKGGPTRSGHLTPAVIVTLPVGGRDETVMRANAWMVQQVLATGVHGVLLCHAQSPEAVRVFVQAARYPFHKQGVGGELQEGWRGNGGQGNAAQIWGISTSEYFKKADTWPLNPEGELILGLKIENKYALANAEKVSKIPGIAFAEWGPGDMGMSLGFPDRHDPPYPPEMQQARTRVLAACKASKLAFLNQVRMDDVEEMIREGVMIGAGANEAVADKGRRFTKRTMPW